MRALIVAALLAMPVSARAEVSIGASVGAGAQGAATYGALDLRLDAAWEHARLGLGARGVWDDAVFRRSDWATPWSVLTLVRDAEITHEIEGTQLAIAAGALAPSQIGHVVDGYRATLDDRWRTGVRGSARHEDLDLVLEIDDLLDIALVAGGLRWAMSPPWAMHLAIASDPRAPTVAGSHTATTFEAGVGRRYTGEGARGDLGVSVVHELSLGTSLVAFADAALDRAGIRFTGRADARVGTGTAGTMFGPLYRIERVAHAGQRSLWDRARDDELEGVSAGVTLGGAHPAGWLELGVRSRPGAGSLGIVRAGAPMGRWVQAGAWAAIGRRDAAGATEVRIAWANTLFSALQVARIYRLDEMEPAPRWSVTAWFGAATE